MKGLSMKVLTSILILLLSMSVFAKITRDQIEFLQLTDPSQDIHYDLDNDKWVCGELNFGGCNVDEFNKFQEKLTNNRAYQNLRYQKSRKIVGNSKVSPVELDASIKHPFLGELILIDSVHYYWIGSMDKNWERRRQVTISNPFYILKTEITQKAWKELMGDNPSYFKGDNKPVENITWYDAQKFINKLNQKENPGMCPDISRIKNNGQLAKIPTGCYRLPTVAEWEVATRGPNGGGKGKTYYWGNQFNGDYLWYNGNSDQSHEVCTAPEEKENNAHPNNLCDTLGNVSEYTIDHWDTEFGVAEEYSHAYVGGDWQTHSTGLRSSRYSGWAKKSPGKQKRNTVGFRLVRVAMNAMVRENDNTFNDWPEQ